MSVNTEKSGPSQTPSQIYSELTSKPPPKSSEAVRPLPLAQLGGDLKKRGHPFWLSSLPPLPWASLWSLSRRPWTPAFQCQLCGQVLGEPACTPCGHVFCASSLLPRAARRRRCPLQCQPLAPGELYRVLPLRNLVQQLRVQCDHSGRGCGHTGRLRELAARVQRCAFGPASGC